MSRLYSILFESDISEDEKLEDKALFDSISDAINLVKLIHSYQIEATEPGPSYGFGDYLYRSTHTTYKIEMLFARITRHQFYYDILDKIKLYRTKPEEIILDDLQLELLDLLYDIVFTSQKFLNQNINTKEMVLFIKRFLRDVFLSFRHLLDSNTSDPLTRTKSEKIIKAYKDSMESPNNKGEKAIKKISSKNKERFKSLIDYIKSYRETLWRSLTHLDSDEKQEEKRKKIAFLNELIGVVESNSLVNSDWNLKHEITVRFNKPIVKTLSKSFIAGLAAMVDKITKPT